MLSVCSVTPTKRNRGSVAARPRDRAEGGASPQARRPARRGAHAERATDRVGETVDVLVEEVEADAALGRAAHQGPEVDGLVRLPGADAAVGSWVRAEVVGADGVDLVAQ